MKLYKRNSNGKPIKWEIESNTDNTFTISYGIVGKSGHSEIFKATRELEKEVNSLIASKRKEGYKELKDLYDNAPERLAGTDLYNYLNTYLPQFNTHSNGDFIPMLCKTLSDNKPFERHSYIGSWKINGERCIVTAAKTLDLFKPISLHYRSREGVDWTSKLSYLDEYILPRLSDVLIEMMLDEGVALDGELYLPGYSINNINSFIKNEELPQHYQLQYWIYDLAIDNMSAIYRYDTLQHYLNNCRITVALKDDHLNNKQRVVLLDEFEVDNLNEAIEYRDKFIDLGFEGLVIRDVEAEYQFGGKRNNAMLKYKKIFDGLFTIKDIIPEGVKRKDLPKFVCINDVNDELFECIINLPQSVQRDILIRKNEFIGKKLFVEYRERSGEKEVPFHAKGIKIV